MGYIIQGSGNISAVDCRRLQQSCEHLHQACILLHDVADVMLLNILHIHQVTSVRVSNASNSLQALQLSFLPGTYYVCQP